MNSIRTVVAVVRPRADSSKGMSRALETFRHNSRDAINEQKQSLPLLKEHGAAYEAKGQARVIHNARGANNCYDCS